MKKQYILVTKNESAYTLVEEALKDKKLLTTDRIVIIKLMSNEMAYLVQNFLYTKLQGND